MAESYFVQDDGFCLNGRIARRPGLHPAAFFRYRPAVPDRNFRYAGSSGTERLAIAKELVAQNVDGIRPDPKADLMPLRVEQLDKMHHGLFNDLLNHVLGYDGPSLEDMEGKSSGV